MNPRKKIVHVIQSLGNGGCENMLLRTLPELGDFEHIILTLKEPGELAPRFEAQGIRVLSGRCRTFLDWNGLRRIQDLLEAQSPDVVLTYLFHADVLGRFFIQPRLGHPVIPFLRTTYNHPRYFLARLFEQSTKTRVRRYLANSAAVKHFYVTRFGIPEENITVIPNGIDLRPFEQPPQEALRNELGLTPNDTIIICVANFHPNKGHTYLLRAFTAVLTYHPALKLLLVGDGPERTRLERKIQTSPARDRVLFLGRRSDVPELLRISHIFVLPTLFEGMSNALMEAMAAGLPVITTDIPENRELAKHEQTGLLVPPRRTPPLARALYDLLSHPEKRTDLALQAKNFLLEHFSLAKVTQEWRAFLHHSGL